MKKQVMTAITGLAIAGTLAATGGVAMAAAPVSGQGQPQLDHFRGGMNSAPGRGMMGRGPGVFGTVASVNGSTFTLTDQRASKTYTVDASAATVFKDAATSSISAIATGDTVMVEGAISGTSVTAKVVRDGLPKGPGAPGMREGNRGEGNGDGQGRAPGMMASSTRPAPVIKGDGKPVIGGTVSAISGNVLTITNLSNSSTYTIDATSATIEKAGAASAVSAITVGDTIIAQGTINGTSVAATSVQDFGAKHDGAPGIAPGTGAAAATTTPAQPPHRGGIGGMFDAVGGFLHNMFGFF